MSSEGLTKDQALKWADELESGKYTQGIAFLYRSPYDSHDGKEYYCCLGVLNCVLGRSAHDVDIYSNILFRKIFGHGSNVFYFMNDKSNNTFREIAAYIRKKVANVAPEPQPLETAS